MRFIWILALSSIAIAQRVENVKAGCSADLEPCKSDGDCCSKICHHLDNGYKVCHYNSTLKAKPKGKNQEKVEKDKTKKPKKNSISSEEKTSVKKPPKKPKNKSSEEKDKRGSKETATTFKIPDYTRQPTKVPKSESVSPTEKYEPLSTPSYFYETKRPINDITETTPTFEFDSESMEHTEKIVFEKPSKRPTINYSVEKDRRFPRQPTSTSNYMRKPSKTPKYEDSTSEESVEEYNIKIVKQPSTPKYVRQTTRRYHSTKPPKVILLHDYTDESTESHAYEKPPKKTHTVMWKHSESESDEHVYVVKPAKKEPAKPDNVIIVSPSKPPKTKPGRQDNVIVLNPSKPSKTKPSPPDNYIIVKPTKPTRNKPAQPEDIYIVRETGSGPKYVIHEEPTTPRTSYYVVKPTEQARPPHQLFVMPSSNPEVVTYPPQLPPVYIINNTDKSKGKKKPKKPKKVKKKKKHSSSSSGE